MRNSPGTVQALNCETQPPVHTQVKGVRSRTSIPQPGFTFIEVLLAIATSAMILAALSAFTVSMGQLYARETFLNARDEHVAGVRSFLRQSLTEAESARENQSIAWTALPGQNENERRFLRFYLSQPTPLLNYGSTYPAGIDCYLDLRDPREFDLYWRPDLLPADEITSADPGFLKFRLSDFLEKVEYLTFITDEERWERQPEPEENDGGQPVLPDYIVFSFKMLDESLKSIRIPLPARNQHPLLP